MKKIFTLVAVCCLFVGNSFAQSDSFKSFRIDAGLLYAMPGGDVLDAGIGYYLNPKFHLNDKVLIGAKLEAAVMASADDDAFDVSAVTSYAATFDYYFTSNSFRPFVGMDAGMYGLGSVEFENTLTTDAGDLTVDGDIDLGTKFGLAPKIGFSAGHFDVAFQYNFIMGQKDGYDEYNHASIKVGFHFGGGKK